MKVEVPKVFPVTQRVAYPRAPPAIVVADIARDDVDTHLVDVPVVCNIIPNVPVALVVSRS